MVCENNAAAFAAATTMTYAEKIRGAPHQVCAKAHHAIMTELCRTLDDMSRIRSCDGKEG
jgi:hypothetical protein